MLHPPIPVGVAFCSGKQYNQYILMRRSDPVNCPYCSKEMVLGALYGEADKAVYWLPKSADRKFFLLNRKNVETRGGIVLDQTTIGFIATERPGTYRCENCNVLMTKL